MAGDRAGKQNRQFIDALVERFRHFSDLFCTSLPCMAEKIKPKPRPSLSPRNEDAHHRRRWAMTGAPRRLVGRNYGGARSRHRWRRWWVSLQLHAGFLKYQ
jgi:hypothetical protein